MKVYIERTSCNYGESTKQHPTSLVKLTEEKVYGKKGVYTDTEWLKSIWYTETDDLGKLIIDLIAHEQTEVVVYNDDSTNNLVLEIYDSYRE